MGKSLGTIIAVITAIGTLLGLYFQYLHWKENKKHNIMTEPGKPRLGELMDEHEDCDCKKKLLA